MSTSYDVIIVGGGVNGCASAYYLSKSGKKVLLLERERIAAKASSAAAGMLGAQVEVTEEGPLFEIAKESRAMFPSLQSELKEFSGIDIELVQKGMLKIARTEKEAQHLKQMLEFQQRLGEKASWLDKEAVLKREPALGGELVGAMDIPMDGHVNPEKLTHAFAKAATNLGAVVKEYVEVYSFQRDKDSVFAVETSEGTYSGASFLVAAGAWSKRLLAELALPIPAYPVKGECFSVITERPLITSTIFTDSCYIVPKSGNRLVVGATMVPHTFSEHVTIGGLSSLMSEATKALPAIATANFERSWAGIRPQTGDELPFLGGHPILKNVLIATGHYRNGILLAPITGKLVADMVDGLRIPIYMSAFSLNRLKEPLKR
ncbi:glycine oxidase ThiO [Sutcliffiella halmapala]|uniref:glycine oxidase ThiO n=1 Tax=Sutcliffiella halmapala TaxID=79882 RepID=UPI0009952E96|nr:glycine oxidase ThiO [Sutcliffiella halmapala]